MCPCSSPGCKTNRCHLGKSRTLRCSGEMVHLLVMLHVGSVGPQPGPWHRDAASKKPHLGIRPRLSHPGRRSCSGAAVSRSPFAVKLCARTLGTQHRSPSEGLLNCSSRRTGRFFKKHKPAF